MSNEASRLRELKVNAGYVPVTVAGQGMLPGATLVPDSARGFMSATIGGLTHGNATTTSNMMLLVRSATAMPGATYAVLVLGPVLVDWAARNASDSTFVSANDLAELRRSVRAAQQFHVHTQRHAKLEALFQHAVTAKWQRRVLAAVLKVMVEQATPIPSAVVPQGAFLEDHWGGTQWSDGRGTSEAGITAIAPDGKIEFVDLYTSQPGQKAHTVINPAAGASVYAHEALLAPHRPSDVALMLPIGELALIDLFRVQAEQCGAGSDAVDQCLSELLAGGYLDVLYPICGSVMPGSDYKGVPTKQNPLITVQFHLPGQVM